MIAAGQIVPSKGIAIRHAPAIVGRLQPELVLDLSRLLSRSLHPTPTGIDRVEMAYARSLIVHASHRLQFAAVHPSGFYGRLREADVRAFLDHTIERWERNGVHERRIDRHRQALHWLWRLKPRPVPGPAGPRVLIQPSPNCLDRPGLIAAKVAREQARLICLVHDLIPITHPEFARPDGAARHKARIRTVEGQADGILVNSHATRDALLEFCGPRLNNRPVRVAPLGVEPSIPIETSSSMARPYFIVIGTIEPRKNHLILLSVWRTLIELLGVAQVPQLLVVGRRGWENENVLDILDRSEMLRGTVIELGRVPDIELRRLLTGARALLMPSLAEGFGMPIAEALAAGVPVIASDLPAHREAGVDVPEYIDPLDGPAWRKSVLAYAGDTSPRRRRQIERMTTWSPMSWDTHIDVVMTLADEVIQC